MTLLFVMNLGFAWGTGAAAAAGGAAIMECSLYGVEILSCGGTGLGGGGFQSSGEAT